MFNKIVIITQALEHASTLNSLIPNSKKIEGLNSVEERNKAIDWFRSSNRPVLIGTNILQTGIDIKEITHLINARGLKSDIATRFRQYRIRLRQTQLLKDNLITYSWKCIG